MLINQIELRYQIALSRAPKIGARLFRVLLDHWQTAQAIFTTHPIALQQAGFDANPREFKRIGSARRLYHWNSEHQGEY